MTHPQVFGQKFTPIRRFLAWKTHPFWPHIPNMTQYGSAPRAVALRFTILVQCEHCLSQLYLADVCLGKALTKQCSTPCLQMNVRNSTWTGENKLTWTKSKEAIKERRDNKKTKTYVSFVRRKVITLSVQLKLGKNTLFVFVNQAEDMSIGV